MRVALFTSTSWRHAYMAHAIAQKHDLALAVREEKGLQSFYEDHPDRGIIEDHFERLVETERSFFSEHHWGNVQGEVTTVARGQLNTADVASRLADADVDAVVVFGCGIIKSPILEVLPPCRTFNLHQGLSPYYRGSGTNFWPFVDGRLNYIGVTLHMIDPGIDTGGIVAHARPEIEGGDSLHTIGCKTVIASAKLLDAVLGTLESGGNIEPISQWAKGTLYRRCDFNGEAIRKAREMESAGYVEDFVMRRKKGFIAPIQLVELGHPVAGSPRLFAWSNQNA